MTKLHRNIFNFIFFCSEPESKEELSHDQQQVSGDQQQVSGDQQQVSGDQQQVSGGQLLPEEGPRPGAASVNGGPIFVIQPDSEEQGLILKNSISAKELLVKFLSSDYFHKLIHKLPTLKFILGIVENYIKKF
jgi:hypothetical protein